MAKQVLSPWLMGVGLVSKRASGRAPSSLQTRETRKVRQLFRASESGKCWGRLKFRRRRRESSGVVAETWVV